MFGIVKASKKFRAKCSANKNNRSQNCSLDIQLLPESQKCVSRVSQVTNNFQPFYFTTKFVLCI